MFNASTRERDSGKTTTLQRLRLGLIGLAAALIGACGGNQMGAGPGDCHDCGTALLTVTDAEGDFLSYQVDITSLQLKKANGTLVQTLSATSRIDFAQLVDLSEVLVAGQIPAGEYVAATLGVDYTGANIVVEDASGNGVPVAPVDAAGVPMGHVELTVQLDHRNKLRITRKRLSHLAFDLDLAASNTVDLAAHTVTVNPFIVATVRPPESRQVRVKGRLDSVDVAGSSYTVDLRPFREDSESGGQMVVHTTGTTRFEINGMVFSGMDGLDALATLDNHPVVHAFGTLSGSDHSFTARRVLAATSARDLHRDYLSGNVLSRSGNTLVVAGFSAQRHDEGDADDSSYELRPVTVTVGPNTLVTRDGQGSGTMGIADISVGQRVEVFGDLTRDGEGHGSLDATAGRVRLNYTQLSGKVVATPLPGAMTLELKSIDGRDPARFDFAGTGTSPATDADPANYEVGTGALATASLASGEYTRLFGFVTPFGAAPPDFRADTFLDFSDRVATVTLGWGLDGTTAPFSASSATGLTVDLENDLRGVIELGARHVDVTSLASLTLAPAATGELTFGIAHRVSQQVDNFSSFADFAAALDTELDGTTAMYRLVAGGTFDAATGAFTVRRLLVVLGD